MKKINLLLWLTLVLFIGTNCIRGEIRDLKGFIRCDKIDIPKDMQCIPGGPFLRGSNAPSFNEDNWEKTYDESPQETIILSTFLLDTDEVSTANYQKCADAGVCDPKMTPHYKGFDAPEQPKTGVSWYAARDYCHWKGRRLPTEAEWEKGARGPDGDIFPWGNEPANCARAVIEEKGKKSCGLGNSPKGATQPAESRPAYRYGLRHMAGNHFEWVNDWYSASYAQCGMQCRGQDPKGPCDGAENCPGAIKRVIRGGSWWWPAEFARGSNRRAHIPLNDPVYHHYGFRCAKSVREN